MAITRGTVASAGMLRIGQTVALVKVAILYLSKTGKSVGLPVVAFTRWRTVELWTALAQ
jgi:hypothetical protein